MSLCKICQEDVVAGVHYSFENNERKFIGLPEKQKYFICYKCEKTIINTDLADSERDILNAFAKKGLCGLNEWYGGRCRNKRPCNRLGHSDI